MVKLECPICFRRYSAKCEPGGIIKIDCGHAVSKIRIVEDERPRGHTARKTLAAGYMPPLGEWPTIDKPEPDIESIDRGDPDE